MHCQSVEYDIVPLLGENGKPPNWNSKVTLGFKVRYRTLME